MVIPESMTSGVAKVGTKGQAVIPKGIRELLGIQPGDQVVYTSHGGHAHIQKMDAQSDDQAWDEFLNAVPPKLRRPLTMADLKRDQKRQYEQRERRAGLRR